MRVLQLHNAYRSDAPSGENDVVDREARSLSEAGVEIVRYVRSSDEIDQLPLRERALVPVMPIWSPRALREVASLLAEQRPDVVHLHNPNPLISMGVVGTAHAAGVPVVMTVHNHRHSCMKGTFRRDGMACHDCLGRPSRLPGVVHGCYRDSRAQSAAMASGMVAHHRSWAAVDRFLAPSFAVRSSLLKGRTISPDKVFVKANAVLQPERVLTLPDGPLVAVFVGRLDEEKGVRLLLSSWAARRTEVGRLVVVGAGPLESEVAAFARRHGDVDFVGRVAPEAVGSFVERAHLVVVPSLVEESFGLVALEGHARGRPVMTTALGGLADLVDESSGWVVPPSVGAWSEALSGIDVSEARRKGAAGRAQYLARYTPERLTAELVQHYEEVRRAA